MADRKLAVVASFLFCVLVIMLLVILYYPEPHDADGDFEEQWTNEIVVKSLRDLEYTKAPEPPPSVKMAEVAKFLENMGAGFLALLAVVCVATGLACLTFAWCCLK